MRGFCLFLFLLLLSGLCFPAPQALAGSIANPRQLAREECETLLHTRSEFVATYEGELERVETKGLSWRHLFTVVRGRRDAAVVMVSRDSKGKSGYFSTSKGFPPYSVVFGAHGELENLVEGDKSWTSEIFSDRKNFETIEIVVGANKTLDHNIHHHYRYLRDDPMEIGGCRIATLVYQDVFDARVNSDGRGPKATFEEEFAYAPDLKIVVKKRVARKDQPMSYGSFSVIEISLESPMWRQ